jgi:SPP1 gp7 family putative phage head morphogenesis protein
MELARRMMQWTNVSNQRTWREAAARSMQSQKLYRLLQAEMQGATGQRVAEIVRDNARYISSLPLECARALTGEVTKAQEAGARAGTIAKMMKSRFPELLRSRVQFISRTEVAKASAALTQARCEALKIDFYEWETSLDARVRASHRKMQGILIPYNDPPSPEALNGEKSTLGNYHAGCAPNCRCPQIPLLSIDDVRWPHKVYSNGAIHMMTLVAFKERFMGVTA